MPFHASLLATIKDTEKIRLVIRQHFIIPLIRAFFWLLFIAAIFVCESLLRINFPNLTMGLAGQILELVRVMLLMLSLVGLLIVWTMYYLNTQVITNERILDINQKSLLKNETSELHLSRFQDVTTEINGVLANIFDFGNVVVQTAGEKADNFVFDNVAHPHAIAKTILDLYEKVKNESPEPDDEQML